MNWLESIEEAIDYIESHLKDDFSVEDVASHVYMLLELITLRVVTQRGMVR